MTRILKKTDIDNASFDGVNLSSLSQMTKLRPVVVCGMPRSGTRMMTDLLNSVDEVLIQNEIPYDVMVKYFEFVNFVDDFYKEFKKRNPKRSGNEWAREKASLTHLFFTFTNKMGALYKDTKLTHFGYKTPSIERAFKDFEKSFGEGLKPYYIYCSRTPDKCWKSVKQMGYLTDVDLFISRYRRSHKNFLEIIKTDESRAIGFNLDEYIASEDKFSFLKENIFSKIGIDLKDSDKDKLLKTPNRNTSKRAGKENLDDEKTLEEMELLKNHELLNKFRKKCKII